MRKSQRDLILSVRKSKSKKAKPAVLVILGQTATGKSDLAVFLARKLDGEIISADSRQVYKGLDIGTGKITKKEMKGVKHHLLDVVSPKKKFSVAEFKELSNSAIAEIFNKNKLPIICGGTGFYIDAVTKGIILPEVPPSPEFRKKITALSDREILLRLQKIDPNRARTIDPKNRVRLIRALEIAEALGKVPKIKEIKPKYNFIKIGLTLPQDLLKEKISARLDKRMKKGMLEEAKNLHKKGLSWKRMYELGLEYRYMALYLQNKITKKEMLERLNIEIYRYAKRQMTWFKRDEEIKWFDPGNNRKIEFYLNSRMRDE